MHLPREDPSFRLATGRKGWPEQPTKEKTMAKADTAEAPMDDALYVPGNHPQEGK